MRGRCAQSPEQFVPMEYFPERLRRLATDREISNAEVARRCGIEERTYANYCSGKREPDLDTLLRICHKMGVTPNDLLLGDETQNQRDNLVRRLAASLEEIDVSDITAVTIAIEALVAARRDMGV